MRSEGLDYIEAIDRTRCRDLGWGELLVVSDYFVRILVRAESDPGFVTEWGTHVAASADYKAILFRRIAEVSAHWDQHLEFLASHHLGSGTQPSNQGPIPSAYCESGLLELIFSESATLGSKFRALRSLIRVSIAHASVAALRSEVPDPNLHEDASGAAMWIHAIAMDLIAVALHAPLAFSGLDHRTLERIERATVRILTNYEIALRGKEAIDRPLIVVDPQLACDVSVIRTIGALLRSMTSDRGSDWQEFERWLDEGVRMLEGGRLARDERPRTAHSHRESWFQPNFGQGDPSCVVQVEDLIRVFVVGRLAVSPGVGPWPVAMPGDIVDLPKRTQVIRFRVPGPAIVPSGSGKLKTAFQSYPLLAWLLAPSDRTVEGDRCWIDGEYGNFFSTLRAGRPFESNRMPADQPAWVPTLSAAIAGRLSRSDLLDSVLMDLDQESATAVASAVQELVDRWLAWRQDVGS